jgi:hypothetical protein
MSRPNTLSQQLTSLLALLGLSAGGCSFHGSFQTGTTTSEGQAHEQAHETAGHERSDADVEARRARARRNADQEIAKIDREARERVAQAEREAAEQERAAEEEAERARQQAAQAERERQQADAAGQPQATAQTASGGTPAAGDQNAPTASAGTNTKHRIDLSRTLRDKTTDPARANLEPVTPNERLTRINSEIDHSALEKKSVIHSRLTQNKADILIAAERKRNAIRVALKQEASEKP